jgi:hypothetical protein
VAVLLSIMPVVFWALLKFNKIPAPAKSSVCCAYSESRYYWVVLALLFRFLMTALFATARQFPSVTAFALFGLLIMLQPYREQRTYYMDLFCHLCLIVQFALQIVVRTSESLGFAVQNSNIFQATIVNAAKASDALRCAFTVTLLL